MNNNLGKPLKLEISLDLIAKKYHEKERDYAKFLVKERDYDKFLVKRERLCQIFSKNPQ